MKSMLNKIIATPLWRKCEVATHTPENGTWESSETIPFYLHPNAFVSNTTQGPYAFHKNRRLLSLS